MIPEDVFRLANKLQAAARAAFPNFKSVFRHADESASLALALAELRITPDSEFGRASAVLNLSGCAFNKVIEIMDPIALPGNMKFNNMAMEENEGMPEELVFISNGDGGGGLFLSRESGKIYDLAFYELSNFDASNHSPVFESFFELLRWYLDPDADITCHSL